MRNDRAHAKVARIELSSPLDLPASLDEGQAFGWTAPDGEADGWWIGTIYGHAVRIRQVNSNDDTPGVLEVSAHDPDLPNDTAAEIVSRYLRLDDDHSRIRKALSADAVLKEIMGRWPGLTILRQEPWECLASFIISAQCHLPRIKRNMQNLAEACEVNGTAWGQMVYRVPEPPEVAGLGEHSLRRIGLGFRAPFLASAAICIAEGDVKLDELRSLPYEDAKSTLLTFKGIGPKIADCILAFSLDHTEAFAVDRWVSRAVTRLFLDGKKTSEEKIAAWGRERFGNYAAYAQQLLFQEEREVAMRERALPGSVMIRQRRQNRAPSIA